MPELRFQVYSDLHIETRNPDDKEAYPKPPAGTPPPILLLAGDTYPIAMPDYEKVMRRVTEPYPLTIAVPGNHEYYNDGAAPIPMQDADVIMRGLRKSIPSFAALNPGVVDVGSDVRIIGCTLWTNIPSDLYAHAEKAMHDYSFIRLAKNTGKNVMLEAAAVAQIHRQQKEWLYAALHDAARNNKRVIVITHHAPTIWLKDADKSGDSYVRNDNTRMYYSTDMERLISTFSDTIKVWVYGHTHKAKQNRQDAGVLFINNGKGYPDQSTGVNESLVFTL